MGKVLITGAAGFTGVHMAAEMKRAGHQVHGLVHRAVSALPHVDEIHACDLADVAGVGRLVDQVQPDIVVHLAGIAFVAHGDVQAIYQTNIVGSRNLLAALAGTSNKPSAVLMASSANVYGNATPGEIDESAPAVPANDYAVSKLAMEHMSRLWSDRLPITIARPFNYTGVGQSASFLLPKIVQHYRDRAPVLELGNLDVDRDFSDVRTVVSCYRRLLEASLEQGSGTFNVCSGVGYSLRDVLALAEELTGHRPEIRVNPAFVRASEVRRLVGSRAALERRIGAVDAIPLRDTLAWMLGSAVT